MLHAALIGFPSTGKSTLFQLMTSAKDSPRGQSKIETQIGISKVPDPRLDQLTAMFNPKKRVPATIEFIDMVAPGRTGAAALVDVAGYKNADALVHVVRAFRDEAVPHPAGSVNPARDAQAMEDELILADLGVVERRLERMEKDLKKNKSADLDKEKELLGRCKTALESGQTLRQLPALAQMHLERGDLVAAEIGPLVSRRIEGAWQAVAKHRRHAGQIDPRQFGGGCCRRRARRQTWRRTCGQIWQQT